MQIPDELINNIYYFSLIQRPYCVELKNIVGIHIQDIIDSTDNYPIFSDVNPENAIYHRKIIELVCWNYGFDIGLVTNLINDECFFAIDKAL